MRFIVKTTEYVAGTYAVEAASEAEALEKFKQRPGRLIDFEGVEQADYMAFEVTVNAIMEVAVDV